MAALVAASLAAAMGPAVMLFTRPSSTAQMALMRNRVTTSCTGPASFFLHNNGIAHLEAPSFAAFLAALAFSFISLVKPKRAGRTTWSMNQAQTFMMRMA